MSAPARKQPKQIGTFKAESVLLLQQIYHDYFSMLDKVSNTLFASPDQLPVRIDLARKLIRNSDILIKSVTQFVNDSFDKYLEPSTSKKKPPKKLKVKRRKQELEARLSQLKLLESDDLEKQLLVSDAVARLNVDHSAELSELNMRIEHLLRQDLHAGSIPIRPRTLFNGLIFAVERLNFDPDETRKTITALAQELEKRYPDYITHCNDYLVNLGVLPDLDENAIEYRYDEERKIESGKRKRKETLFQLVNTGDADTSTSESKDEIEERAIQEAFSKLIAEASNDLDLQKHLLKADSSSTLETTDSFIQHFQESNPLPVLTDPSGGYLDESEYSPLKDQVSHYLEESGTSINETAANTVSMLSMLFDEINKDQNVSPYMKTLVNHMQTPMMKAALLDPTFFSDTDNPAQRLMDTIADAGATWAPAENRRRDSLYNKIASVIERVNTEFDDDYQVFDQCQEDLDLFLKAEKRRAKLIEERMITTEKAKARTHTARQVAASHTEALVQKKLASQKKAYDPCIARFFKGPWKQALFYIHNIEESTEGEGWKRAVGLEEKLLDALDSSDEQQHDQVISELEKQLNEVGIQPSEIVSWVNQISTAFSTVENEIMAEPVEEALEAFAVEEYPEIQPARTDNTIRDSLAETDFEKQTDPEKETDFEKETDLAKEDAPEKATESEAENEPSEPDRYDEMAAELSTNTWIRRTENGMTTKARVAAIIPVTDTIILVNRNGSKSQSITRKDFARLLRRDEISVIENGMMFDRALEAVINTLRK
ncbi:MAG: hypothetical protein CSB48_10910 [Proteobacteria bacterium]|nr:MAG: hypothetical protein CSB48_10910 [Pseudomonadota bacterium]PIE40051.1 MAG: hypothetical protein CSA51_02675 [Gammaproteobacteria bacterium]